MLSNKLEQELNSMGFRNVCETELVLNNEKQIKSVYKTFLKRISDKMHIELNHFIYVNLNYLQFIEEMNENGLLYRDCIEEKIYLEIQLPTNDNNIFVSDIIDKIREMRKEVEIYNAKSKI